LEGVKKYLFPREKNNKLNMYNKYKPINYTLKNNYLEVYDFIQSPYEYSFNIEIKDNILKEHFILRLLNHIKKVQNNMILLSKNLENLPFEIKNKQILINRAIIHDEDKFSDKLIKGEFLIHEFWHNKRKNLSIEHINTKIIKQTNNFHYENNSHHIEYHIKHKTTPSNLDIYEMCCDMSAISQELNIENYDEYFKKNLIKQYPFFKDNEKTFFKVFDVLKKINKKQIY